MFLTPAFASSDQTIVGLPCSALTMLLDVYTTGCEGAMRDILSDDAFVDTLAFLGRNYDTLKEQQMHLALAKRCSFDATTPGEITFTGFVEWYRRTYQQIHEEPEAQSDSGDGGTDVHTNEPYEFTKVDNSWAEVPLLRLSSDLEPTSKSRHEDHGHKVATSPKALPQRATALLAPGPHWS